MSSEKEKPQHLDEIFSLEIWNIEGISIEFGLTDSFIKEASSLKSEKELIDFFLGEFESLYKTIVIHFQATKTLPAKGDVIEIGYEVSLRDFIDNRLIYTINNKDEAKYYF